MSSLGDALLDGDGPPVKALYRLQLQPGRGRPDQARSCAGFAREDLFTVVHDASSRPTPPTTPTSSCRRPRSSSTSTSTRRTATSTCAQPAGDRAAGRGEAEHRDLPPPGRAHGLRRAGAFATSDETMIRQALARRTRACAGIDFEALEERGLAAARRARVRTRRSPRAASRRRPGSASSTASGSRRMGLDPLPTYTPPLERRRPRRSWRRAIRSRSSRRRAHHFLNSTFVNLPLVPRQRERAAPRHPPARTRRARGITDRRLACASSTTAARSAPRAGHRQGASGRAWWRLSIWWRKLSPDGTQRQRGDLAAR